MALITSSMIFAEEKTIEIKSHISKIIMTDKGNYRLELTERAAAYFADQKHSPCLQLAIKESKKATLKVAAYSLNVLDCKI